MWTGGQFLKIIIKKNNVFYYYKMWTCEQEAVFVFHVFFLSCILQNIFKKCGQVNKFWKFWKKNNLICFIIRKCGDVDKKLSFYFMFSFVLVPSKLFSRSVDRWTSSESSEKNNFHLMYFIIIKCGLVEKKLSFYLIFSLFCVPSKIFSKSVDRWTSSENFDFLLNWCISVL